MENDMPWPAPPPPYIHLSTANPYMIDVQTGIQYPYYEDHLELKAELNRFNPTWRHNFNEFDYMADKLNGADKPRTKLFVDACKALQKKLVENQLTDEQVNTFREKMEDFFTKGDGGFPRFYGNPNRDLHDRDLWKLAKAAVTLYEHCRP